MKTTIKQSIKVAKKRVRTVKDYVALGMQGKKTLEAWQDIITRLEGLEKLYEQINLHYKTFSYLEKDPVIQDIQSKLKELQ